MHSLHSVENRVCEYNDGCFTPPSVLFSVISWREQDMCWWDDDNYVCGVLYSARSLKQRVMDRHIVILDPTRIFALNHLQMRAKIELASTDFLVFCLTRTGIESMIVRTRAKIFNKMNLLYTNRWKSRRDVGTFKNVDCLLKNMSTKHSKYVVNQKPGHSPII